MDYLRLLQIIADYLRLFVLGLFVNYLKPGLFESILRLFDFQLFVDNLKHCLFEIIFLCMICGLFET